MARIATGLAFAALLLSGCAGMLAQPDGRDRQAAVAPVPVPKSKPQPDAGAAAPPAGKGERQEKPATEPRATDAAEHGPGSGAAAPKEPSGGGVPGGMPPDGVAPPVPTGPSDPRRLVGMDEKAIMTLLGEPTWTEDVPPAKYWQYATQSCVLRVFFFMEMTTRDFRALSYELTSSDDAPNVHEQCFAQLLAQASDHPAPGHRS